MVLPADFSQLTVPEQLFVAVNRERVDRGLAPFTGLATALDERRTEGSRRGAAPAAPGPVLPLGRRRSGSARSTTASTPTTSGCTTTARTAASRGVRAARPRGAGPTATSSCTGSVRATSRWEPPSTRPATPRPVTGAGPHWPPCWPRLDAAPGTYVYTWKQRPRRPRRPGRCRHSGRSPPRSPAPGSPTPATTCTPVPDYTSICASGLDNSPACIDAVLARRSTTPTRSRASGPWCCRPTSPS